MLQKIIATLNPSITQINDRLTACTDDSARIELINKKLQLAAQHNDISLLKHLFKVIEQVPQKPCSSESPFTYHGTHENLIGDLKDAEAFIATHIPKHLQFIFDTPQRGKFHKEGPALKHHLQAMLNALRDIQSFSDILDKRYLMLIKDHADFFIYFSLLHDIGKAYTLQIKNDGALQYMDHEKISVELLRSREFHHLRDALPSFNELEITIRHHSAFFDKDDIADEYKLLIQEGGWFTPLSIDLLLCAIFLDMAWRPSPTFNIDMARVQRGIATWDAIREEKNW